MVILLLRYNELGLKSARVRRRFQKQMIQNIEDKFIRSEIDCFINYDWGRIYIETDNENESVKILRTIFGLSSVSPVICVSSKLDEITRATIDFCQDKIGICTSFALRTRRTGQHDYTSMELAEHVGAAILAKYKDRNIRVNLTKPDEEIFIEVRNNKSYIYSETYPGPGGLPLGTQGKIIGFITDPYSYIAIWLMMKRGCRVFPVYFGSKKQNRGFNEPQAAKQLEILKPWAQNLKLNVIEMEKDNDLGNFGNINNMINNEKLINFSQFINAKGICFSYQMKDLSIEPFDNRSGLPVFFPLIGLEDKFITQLEKQIKIV